MWHGATLCSMWYGMNTDSPWVRARSLCTTRFRAGLDGSVPMNIACVSGEDKTQSLYTRMVRCSCTFIILFANRGIYHRSS